MDTERGVLAGFAESAGGHNHKELIPFLRANFLHVRIEVRRTDSSWGNTVDLNVRAGNIQRHRLREVHHRSQSSSVRLVVMPSDWRGIGVVK